MGYRADRATHIGPAFAQNVRFATRIGMASETNVYPDPEQGQPVEQVLARRSVVGRAMIGAIRLYQISLSKAFPPSCRFYPSCSEYTAQAIAKYGPLKGCWLGTKRILRCHPLTPGGYDPVP